MNQRAPFPFDELNVVWNVSGDAFQKLAQFQRAVRGVSSDPLKISPGRAF